MMNFLAIDVGGANLKAADGRGFAESQFFALWRNPNRLAQELRTLIAESPPSDHLLVTMTGELADCFATKSEGVRFILDALNTAADGRHTRVYLVDGRMVTPQVALKDPLLAAASNWHVLARFSARYTDTGPGLLLDIGSTTCDIVPLVDGNVAAHGTNDTKRLIHGELVYTGVDRSPTCAIARSVPYRGNDCPLAQELFATMRDVYLILGQLPEDATSKHTTDGRPSTKKEARSRLGRSICADEEQFNHKDAVAIAQSLADSQVSLIADGVARVIQQMQVPPQTVIISGQGEYVLRRVVERAFSKIRVVAFSRELGPSVSRCAPAHALAVLGREGAEA